MESCSLHKSLQKLVHLEGRVDISKMIMKKTYPGHLLIFVHNGKAALAKVHLYRTEVERYSSVKKEKESLVQYAKRTDTKPKTLRS